MSDFARVTLSALLAVAVGWPPTPVDAADAGGAASAAGALVYRPPLRGAPASRVGGGTRGVDTESWTLYVLAPEDTGLTTAAQPTLYWFTSQPIRRPVEITLTRPGATRPVLEVTLQGPHRAGVHAIPLARWKVTIEPEAEYEWFVSVVSDPSQRSTDQVAGGTIRRVSPPEGLQAPARGAPGAAAAYAEAGLWYDAVEALSRQIDATPDSRALREQRAALMRQVGLEVPAEGI
jgi:hypothetical protein